MRDDSWSRRAVLAGSSGLGALAVVGTTGGASTAGGDGSSERQEGTDTTSCTPGHVEGNSACTQIRNDREVLTRFDATDTDLVTTFGYPCGWTATTNQYDDRVQANVTRSDVGPEGAYVDVQVRNYHEPVDERHLDDVAAEGSYDEVVYSYDGKDRTGLVSTADTAQFGTLAHAVVPSPETEGLTHVEFVSTMKGGDCPQPQPDYRLVKEMLATLEPNRPVASVSMSDQRVSGDVETQAVTVDSVYLPDGGFVAVYDTPLQEDDLAATIVGVSSRLESGRSENVRIVLDASISDTRDVVAVPHRDDGDNQFGFGATPGSDGPYVGQDMERVTDRATISVEGASSGGSSGQTTEADAPGFGIGASLGGLGLASLLFRWRTRRARDE